MVLFDELKSIAKVLQEAGKIELYEKILTIQQQLLEMQNKIGIQDDIIRDLEEKLKIQGNIYFEDNVCWIKNKGGTNEGPYCSACWDKNKKLVHLHHEGQDWDTWYCPVCATGVNKKIRVSSPKKRP